MAQQYSSFYPTNPVMPDPSRSSVGFEFIPGRSHHDGASQPFVDVAPAWSIYQQSSGSEYGVAYHALVSRSGITRDQTDLESQSTRRTSSENRHSQSTSPSSFDGNVEPEPFVQLSPTISPPPPNAPKGPAAERGGRQLSRHPGTGQGNTPREPPPNAPKAPAALRMQLATLTNGSSHQQSMSAANGQFSSSKTWISPEAELRAKFSKFKKELQVMGCRESVVLPLSFDDFKDDLEVCKVRRREMRNRLQQAREAQVHGERETGPSVGFLSGLFDPSFADTWCAAGESNGWPSRMEYRRLGDNNRALPQPQRQRDNQEGDHTSKWSHMASYSHHAAFHAGARDGPLHMTIYDANDDADDEASGDANGIDDFRQCRALVKDLLESRDGTSASLPANIGEL